MNLYESELLDRVFGQKTHAGTGEINENCRAEVAKIFSHDIASHSNI